MTYSEQDVLRVAKRVNNPKRSYLLVNPLQGKHIPVSPARSLAMLDALGAQLARAYPEAGLVIGFAETATAIGAAAAARLGEDCLYLHTTREAFPQAEEWVLFSEEHSHAAEQKLCGDGLEERIRGTRAVLFVDDEISTGKTLRNMLDQLRARYPALAEKRLAAASLLNRVTPEDMERLARAGLECRWLVKAESAGPDRAVEGLRAEPAPAVTAAEGRKFTRRTLDCPPLPDPRMGVRIGRYQEGCREMARAFQSAAAQDLEGLDRLVVLGTEECMYPALLLGRALEEQGRSVLCHATTRSPIGICRSPGYPITSGRRLSSFYEAGRDTYLYNFSPCDGVIVVSDAPQFRPDALNELIAAWAPFGCRKTFFLQGGRDVWYV